MSAGKKRVSNSNAFDIASMRTSGSKTSNSPRKADKPFFEVMVCIYQEGEKKGKPTGNMLVNFKSTWEKRDEACRGPTYVYVLSPCFSYPIVLYS